MRKEFHKVYQLIGILSPSDDYIGFVYPVFQCPEDKKYYFQDGDENLIVQDFLPVDDFKLLGQVTLTNKLIKSNCKQEFVTKLFNYTLFCFKTDADSIQVGNYKEMKEFLKTFKCHNSDVQEQINLFLNWKE